jgi:D-hexose-6-phosphate mutarotase
MSFTSQRGNQKWFFVCEVKQMKLYYLEDKNTQAQAIVSPLGGQVIGYIKDGKEIICLQRTIGTKLRGGIPICFPFFGPPKPRFAGEPQHGWLRNQELDLYREITPPIAVSFHGIWEKMGSEVVARDKRYPWALEYWAYTSLLDRGALGIMLRVRRLKDDIKEKMPINLAFHPYFANLGRRAVKIGNKEITDFNEKAQIIPLNGQKELLIDLGQKKIIMTLTRGFGDDSCVALWSDNNEYFCVEPMMTHPDFFDTPKGRYLDQEEVLIFACTLFVLP